MARKKKSTVIEDVIGLVALLPWWVGIAMALVGYFALHHWATLPVVVNPKNMSGLVTSSWTRGLAMVGQYLVPALCLAGAVLSFVKRRRRQQLVADAIAVKGADAIDQMSWREFELLIGEAFRMQGYSVTEIGGRGADGGVDLELRKGSEKFLVQCKQWKAFKVSVMIVRELYGVMAAQGAAGGFVVTSGRFTSDAAEFAAGRNITLIDGAQLRGLLSKAKVAPMRRAPAGIEPTFEGGTAKDFQNTQPSPKPPPGCPACGATMVQRIAKRGANAGEKFWGCSQYSTGCRGTRNAG